MWSYSAGRLRRADTGSDGDFSLTLCDRIFILFVVLCGQSHHFWSPVSTIWPTSAVSSLTPGSYTRLKASKHQKRTQTVLLEILPLGPPTQAFSLFYGWLDVLSGVWESLWHHHRCPLSLLTPVWMNFPSFAYPWWALGIELHVNGFIETLIHRSYSLSSAHPCRKLQSALS